MAEKKYRSIDEITHNGKPLREILEAHRSWFESEGKTGTRADLTAADLHEADLHGADLRLANLSRTSLIRTDLSKADLSKANLHGADVSRADLGGADLGRAELSGADLHGANLSGADLFGANLSGANLSVLDLSGANLSDANLCWANLFRANLMRANLSEAMMFSAAINDCDLSSVIGLETVRHYGPSSIGIDTIFKSQGKIPEAFLKGVGVPERFIRFVLELRDKPIEYYKCFISYADEDAQFAERLYTDLQNRGVLCWLYHKSARAGRGVQEQIGRAIEYDYEKVIVICSRNSLNSSGVINEIDRAIQREDAEKRRDILVSIRIDDYVFGKWDKQDWEAAYKARLKSKHIEDFTDWQNANKYGSALDRLLEELNRKQADMP